VIVDQSIHPPCLLFIPHSTLFNELIGKRIPNFDNRTVVHQVGLHLDTNFEFTFLRVELDALPGLLLVLHGDNQTRGFVPPVAHSTLRGCIDVEIVLDLTLSLC